MKKLIIIILVLVSAECFAAKMPKELHGFWYYYKYATQDNLDLRYSEGARIKYLFHVFEDRIEYPNGATMYFEEISIRENGPERIIYDVFLKDSSISLSIMLMKHAHVWNITHWLGEYMLTVHFFVPHKKDLEL